MSNPTNMEDFIKAVKEDLTDRVAEKEQGKGSLLKNLAEKKEQIANRPAPARGDHAIGGAVL